MNEIITNLHVHTLYSDGSGTYSDIAKAASKAGLDVVLVTDHDILVKGVNGYYQEGERQILILVGEEVHDRALLPQKNHMLVFGINRDMVSKAEDPQELIDQVNKQGGSCFIAHPFEDAMPIMGETDITWENWGVEGFTGLEIWNSLSELKSVVHTWPEALFHAFFPQFIAHGPNALTLNKWDELLAQDKKIAAVGGSDAHQLNYKVGPFIKKIFPYEFHFRSVNTHLLIPEPLSGELAIDQRMVYDALKNGRGFVGYDLLVETRGFRFTAQGKNQTVVMGEEIKIKGGITFQIRVPAKAECRLVKEGVVLKTWVGKDLCTYITDQPGAYRVECYIRYLGKRRGWIFSNPIYVRE